jgi:hypothetical protein
VDVVEVAATRIEALIAAAVGVLEVVEGAEDAGLQAIWICTKTIGISLLMPCIFVCPIFLATLKLHHQRSSQK